MNGGLDALDIGPMLEMVGLGEPAPVVQPATRKPRKRLTRKTAPKIPQAGSVSGKIYGTDFRPTVVELKEKTLILRQGKVFDPKGQITITLDSKKWEVPTKSKFNERSIKKLELLVKHDGKDEAEKKTLKKSYVLDLRFGEIEGNVLSGYIKLTTGGTKPTEVTGQFKASLDGFRMVKGEPDLSSDADETLMYVALAHILKDDPKKPISKVGYRNAEYDTVGRNRKGSIEVEYRLGKKKKKVTEKFEFTKRGNNWIVTSSEKLD